MVVQLLQWNARGILGHRHEFHQLLVANSFDIICIQASFLKPDIQYCPPGYNGIRCDRQTAKGGLVIFTKKGLIYTEHKRPADMECQAVTIRTSVGMVSVVNVYVPPGTDVSPPPFSDLFQRTNTIIVGDMNARNRLWGSDTDDVRGRVLESAIDANSYVVLNNGQGTHQTNSGSMTHIDVSLSSRKLATKCKWTTLNNLMGSDHAPILISINARPEQQLSSVPKWKLTSADWTIFRQSVENQIQAVTINEHEEVDQFNSKVVDILITAAEESIPKTRLSL